MAYDPSSVIIGTRLIKDKNTAGTIVDDNGEWVSGKVEVEVLGSTGNTLGVHSFDVTNKKYESWREDYDKMDKQTILDTYFPDVETEDASESELQRVQRESEESTEAKKKEVAEQEAKDAKARETPARTEKVEYRSFSNGKETTKTRTRKVKDTPVTNVRPVGDPAKVPSNPEQEFSNTEMIAKGASAAGSPVGNPEQSAPNVPEDEFTKTGGNDTASPATNGVDRNVVPVGGDAKTNKQVREA